MAQLKYELRNVTEPNLLEDIFPYSRVPHIPFSGRTAEEIDGVMVEFSPADAAARDIHLTDTTFRDGQQARPPYTVEQIATLFKLLSRLGGPKGVIRQAEFFLYTKKDRQAVDECRALDLPYPKIVGWIRADEGDLHRVVETGLNETGILTSSSDYHIFCRDKLDRRKAFDKYVSVIESAIDAGIRPRCDLEDVTRADIDGFVVPFVQKMMQMSETLPEELKIKIRLCDTMGFGISSPGADLPRSVPKLVYRMLHDAGVPSERLLWHGHNDFHRVHVNGFSAWLYGVNGNDAALLGTGERTGNPPLEGAVIDYVGLKGKDTGVDLRVISEIAEYYERDIGVSIPAQYPFVGSDFNVTRAGIHADGLRRDERIYNIFDTAHILNRPPKVAITDNSGVGGVAHWVNAFLGLEGDDRLSKMKVHRVARWVIDQYEVDGRTTAISDTEMAEQVRIHLPDHYARAMQRP